MVPPFSISSRQPNSCIYELGIRDDVGSSLRPLAEQSILMIGPFPWAESFVEALDGVCTEGVAG